MIQSKHTFKYVLETKHVSKYIEHKQFYSGFTIYPFIATEHFDVKTPNFNVTSHYSQNIQA